MSSIKISPIESSSSCSLIPIIKNSNNENISLIKPLEKQMTFEIKTDSFNRKIQVKTKQEDTIYTTNKFYPIATCSTTNSSTSPKTIQIQRSPNSTISNSSIQRVRLSVSSIPFDNEKTENSSKMIENFIEKNLKKKDEKKSFDHRPLLNLINELDQSDENILPSSTKILPAKQILPFKPIILQKKYQEPIGQFDIINNNKKKFLRSQTFTNSNTSDNPSIFSNNSDDKSLLSISTTSLTNISNTNATPTSQTNIDDKNEAKRKAIAMQMYDTEKSYVEALKNLVTKYYLPMKDKNIVSNELINDIFYKIPEIHIHHTAFLISLSQKLIQWDNKQTVGDLLLQMFTRTSVIETYTSFVNNYKRAQIAINLCRDISSFNKFLEQQARDHRGKLTLRDLIIQPVQRIPRYELYIKDFLCCTNLNHPDYQLLIKCQSEIHSLAEQIDQVQKEVRSTEFNINNNSLEIFQDIIENLTDLIYPNRYYIRHDIVTLQSSSGIKKDRCIFLFNDLIIITSCKRHCGNLAKKTNNALIVNSPSGKQYIENAKHKLIMKISLENVDISTDHLKKRGSSITTPPSLKKFSSTINNISDKQRHLEEDIIILGQMTDLAKTITIPHQQLDESIKETLNIVNKQLIDETTSITNLESNYIQLIINTTEHSETIDVLFSSLENKITWEKNFLDAKRILFDISAGGKNAIFQHVFPLPYYRSGSQLTCGTIDSYSNDLCLCNTEGDLFLINIDSDIELKSFYNITSSKIISIAYIPSNKNIQIKNENKQNLILKHQSINKYVLFDIDSSDDDDDYDNDNNQIDQQDNLSIHLLENSIQNQYDHTLWLGTLNGGLFIYECSQTMKIIGRKNRIVKQLNSSIHSILYYDNRVYLALNHGQICIFKRDIINENNLSWNFDNPLIKTIDDNVDPISVISLVEGKLWCGIRDKIFVICPNSLDIQHSFIVDDYHRHICSIAVGNCSMKHVWIASQDSHDIRLYHSINFICLLEISIKTSVIQKLQVCDDIIRAHKLGCLHISTLHVYKETLWIGTSAGIILNLRILQLIDTLSTNKLTVNSTQLESLSFGHAGPVRFILSKIDDGTNNIIISIGDGFEDFTNNNENLGKDDILTHLIFWKL